MRYYYICIFFLLQNIFDPQQSFQLEDRKAFNIKVNPSGAVLLKATPSSK